MDSQLSKDFLNSFLGFLLTIASGSKTVRV